jgi:hypothetical protein
MTSMKTRTRRLLLVALAAASVLTPPVQADFAHFITADGARLMDGGKAFRFIGFNVPTLFYVEDEMAFEQTNPYGLPTEFELRDLYETVVEMGGRVVRAYTIPVRNRNFPPESVTYVEAPGVFNEEAFRAMDLALALAAEYGVRVVLPLVNNWQWMGGRPNYAEFRGLPADAFWTDRQLMADFKQTIDFVLNRENTLTGTRYRDDRTILAWETGNELESPASGRWKSAATSRASTAITCSSTAPRRCGRRAVLPHCRRTCRRSRPWTCSARTTTKPARPPCWRTCSGRWRPSTAGSRCCSANSASSARPASQRYWTT